MGWHTEPEYDDQDTVEGDAVDSVIDDDDDVVVRISSGGRARLLTIDHAERLTEGGAARDKTKRPE